MITFDLIIEQPHNDTNEYVYDASTHSIRLERIARVDTPLFADYGIVANAVTPRGEPLRAWLLCDVPNSPQARVAAHAVGALEYHRGELTEQVILAVPTADPRYAHVNEFNALPGPHRAALQRWLEESARWLDANSAEELIHLARQRARLAQVEERGRAGKRPAWEAGSEFNYLAHLARETALHTQAEAALFTVPYRFQLHLRLCLESNERILFWVQRPLFTISRIIRLGGRPQRQGLLVITDQQCLWMVDPVTATVSLEGGYGYIARALPVELLANATTIEKSDHILLQIASGKASAANPFEIAFPYAARNELEQAVRLLRAFVPCPHEYHLRRVALPRVPQIEVSDPMAHDHKETRTVIESLQNAVTAQLKGETVYAQAFLPLWTDDGAKLLTVTDRRLIFTGSRARSPESAHAIFDLCSVVGTEICYSVLGSWFRLYFSRGADLKIEFPLTAFKGFNACWRMIRQLCINTSRCNE